MTDAQLPSIACPPSISVTAAPGQCAAAATYATPTATDNCAVQSAFLLSGGGSGSQFTAGTNAVVWRAVDNSGTSSTCAFTVTVACGPSPTNSPSRPPQWGGDVTAERDVVRDAVTPPHRGGREGLGLHLAPNPATTEVQVWVENLGENDGVLSVFDAMGRMMWQQRFGSETLTSGEQTRIDLDDRWKAGVYMVVLRTDDKIFSPHSRMHTFAGLIH